MSDILGAFLKCPFTAESTPTDEKLFANEMVKRKNFTFIEVTF